MLAGRDEGSVKCARVEVAGSDDISTKFGRITLPTIIEMLRIKSRFVLKRNAARDYLDVAAPSARIDEEEGPGMGRSRAGRHRSLLPAGQWGVACHTRLETRVPSRKKTLGRLRARFGADLRTLKKEARTQSVRAAGDGG